MCTRKFFNAVPKNKYVDRPVAIFEFGSDKSFDDKIEQTDLYCVNALIDTGSLCESHFPTASARDANAGAAAAGGAEGESAISTASNCRAVFGVTGHLNSDGFICALQITGYAPLAQQGANGYNKIAKVVIFREDDFASLERGSARCCHAYICHVVHVILCDLYH